ncbi:MAG: hypothetical protein P8Y64_14275, partial [Gammaproteobacteria bacterium]
MKKKILFIAVLAGAITAIAFLGSQAAPSSQASAHHALPKVTVARVLSRDIDNTYVFTGKLKAVNTV